MFPSLSSARVFRIVEFMRTSSHQSHYDWVANNVHQNADVIDVNGNLMMMMMMMMMKSY